MKKIFVLWLGAVLSLSAAVPSYSLYADRPFPETARQEAAAHAEALPEDIADQFLSGRHRLDEYEAAVSESYVKNFIKEVEALPVLDGFDTEQYGSIAPQILFVPRSVMFFLDGLANGGRILINLGRGQLTTNRYKQVSIHELFHLGTTGLGIEWLDEAFAVLFTQRADEAAGREPFAFGDNAVGRNDLRVGELLSRLIGGEDQFAQMASEKDAYTLVAEAFDAAQGYVSFEDFSFANISIRTNGEDETFAKNLEYMEHMLNNPAPSESDARLAEIRAFYSFPAREAAVKLGGGLSALVNGSETPAQSLDYFTRRVIRASSDDIFYPGEGDVQTNMEETALEIAYEYAALAPWKRKDTAVAGSADKTDSSREEMLKFLWADGVTALRLERFVKEYGLDVSAGSVMKDAAVYALSGELLETALGPQAFASLNYLPESAETAYPDMIRSFKERTGRELTAMLQAAAAEDSAEVFAEVFKDEGEAALLIDEAVNLPSASPAEMLRQVIQVCYFQPVKDGVIGGERAAEELTAFRTKNLELLTGRKLLEAVDAALAAVE